MNLKQALYVKTIAEEGGVTAAARKLFVSQPSLSQMLRLIEEELGLPLFERGTFRPTYAGERYLHAANVMLSTNEILEHELQEIRQEDSGRLRLGISRQRSASLLPLVLPEFSRLHPHVELELREEGSAVLERMLRDGEVDLAFASTNPVTPGLTYRLIQRETIGILAGDDSDLVRELPVGTRIRLERVGRGPFIALKAGHNIRVIQDLIFQERNLQPEIYLETDTMETARQVTMSGACYMLCTDSLAGVGTRFYPLEGYENLRHFYACVRQGQPVPKYMLTFIDLMERAFNRNRAQT